MKPHNGAIRQRASGGFIRSIAEATPVRSFIRRILRWPTERTPLRARARIAREYRSLLFVTLCSLHKAAVQLLRARTISISPTQSSLELIQLMNVWPGPLSRRWPNNKTFPLANRLIKWLFGGGTPVGIHRVRHEEQRQQRNCPRDKARIYFCRTVT